MHIYGVDFTSAPAPRKPITLVSARLERRTLFIEGCQELSSLASFEAFLRSDPPWVSACDFPFGLPRILLERLTWPTEWSAYMRLVVGLSKNEFEQVLTDYRLARPAGGRHHLRLTDKLAGACSPMMLYRVPVAKMFFQGAPRLWQSGVSVPPLRPAIDQRVVLEGYPALVARTFIRRQSYKSDARIYQTSQRLLARQQLLQALCSPDLLSTYGIMLHLPEAFHQQLLADPMGDMLDALLCALQAAWASLQPGYGIPAHCDPAEGWIVDPHLLFPL
jgi:hypothetical protein